MINIFLVRHGQTYTNVQRLVCGQMDTELTTLGYRQAVEAAEKIKGVDFSFCYTSPLVRATKTASCFGALDKFDLVDELMEMNTGEYSYYQVEDLWKLNFRYKYQGRYKNQRYPNGESLAVLYDRISSWFNARLAGDWSDGTNVLVVGHEATVVCALHYFLQIPLDNYPSFLVANGGVVKITHDILENQTRVQFI